MNSDGKLTVVGWSSSRSQHYHYFGTDTSLARALLYISAVVSFIGLAGVGLDDMYIRNIGIIGYAVVFPIATAVMSAMFRRVWFTK